MESDFLTAPAGKVWHVKIDNRDGAPEHHNFAVASGRTFEERIFQSPNFFTGTFTFDIPALPAGSYLFICTVHPGVMTGTLTIK
jgi:plastocyanin